MFLNRKILFIPLALIFLVIFYYITSFIVFLYSPVSSNNEEIIVNIEYGSSFKATSKMLYDKDLIKDGRKFLILGRIRRASSKIRAGELMFRKDMTPLEVLDTLLYGAPVTYTFTVPEGYNIFQIADVLESKGIINESTEFIEAAKDLSFIRRLGIKGYTAEGYLFPDTYTVSKVLDARLLVELMYRKYKEVFTEALAQKAQRLNFSEHEIITLASIIEKETGAEWERKLISSVFHNRLKKGIRLQSDPTTIYGIGVAYDGNLKKEHLKGYTPYNTYKIFGLPPGPIASPGEEAVLAALYPANTNYLYFVSKNDGTHHFSETYKEHEKAVRRFQKRRSARIGKSWRDLK